MGSPVSHVQFDKPQNFSEGQLAKKGVFTCFWGCRKEFLSLEDAQYHWEMETCFGKEESDKTVEMMHEIAANTTRLGKPVLQPIKVSGKEVVRNSTDKAGKFLETGLHKSTTLEESLKTLPETDLMWDTENWVLTSPFYSGFS